uniref:Possible tRNA binding domain-containing protein n=1 Tax=Panagrolaimus davidi TaxID=227884 RepID=A0A914QB09_9BILA
MFKSLNTEDDPTLGNWIGDFFQKFRQCLINLLGFRFRKFDPQLALYLMFIRNNQALTQMRQKCKRKDLVPTLVSLFFTEKFAGTVNLNAIQSAILVAIGLQHKTVDELASELNLPVNQILAIFLKGIRTLFDYLDESFFNVIEDDIEESRKDVATNDENMEKLRSLDENLREDEECVKSRPGAGTGSPV